jgi:hypothetical protein
MAHIRTMYCICFVSEQLFHAGGHQSSKRVRCAVAGPKPCLLMIEALTAASACCCRSMHLLLQRHLILRSCEDPVLQCLHGAGCCSGLVPGGLTHRGDCRSVAYAHVFTRNLLTCQGRIPYAAVCCCSNKRSSTACIWIDGSVMTPQLPQSMRQRAELMKTQHKIIKCESWQGAG